MNATSYPGRKPARASRGEQFETVVLVLILLTVGGFAGAASFTHVHDWTMNNSLPGVPDWFGWANAVVSELVPIAALLVMRRRRRAGQPVTYPVFLLGGALILSVTAQLAVAKPGLSGGLVSVVPALAFAALAKLVLGKTAVPQEEPAAVEPAAMPEPAAPVVFRPEVYTRIPDFDATPASDEPAGVDHLVTVEPIAKPARTGVGPLTVAARSAVEPTGVNGYPVAVNA